jgi:septum formation protein
MLSSPVLTPTIYLASRSPRRVELLQQIGLRCETLPADIDETQLMDETAEHYVLRLAQQKAEACLQRLSLTQRAQPVLAADTTVVLAGLVLGKPEHDDDARRMLRLLSGSRHQVHTAVALAFKGRLEVVLSTTQVEMMALTDAQIEAYIASGEHLDKAGSYGIQGLAATWIMRIEGSYSGVMGLPLYETAALLRTHGIIDSVALAPA